MATRYFEEYDRLGNLLRRIPYEVDDNQIEREEAPERLRQALTALEQWSNDAKTAQELNAMTAAQRVQRQAELEQRVALLAKAVKRLARLVAE